MENRERERAARRANRRTNNRFGSLVYQNHIYMERVTGDMRKSTTSDWDMDSWVRQDLCYRMFLCGCASFVCVCSLCLFDFLPVRLSVCLSARLTSTRDRIYSCFQCWWWWWWLMMMKTFVRASIGHYFKIKFARYALLAENVNRN